MRAIRSINNNIAVCVDSAGTELIAMGKGIGYGKMPHEVDLDDVTHTYYNVDKRQLEGVRDIPADVLAFAAAENDRVRGQLAYQLSPNFVFTLADHIAFAIKRARENLQVRMPLAFISSRTTRTSTGSAARWSAASAARSRRRCATTRRPASRWGS